MVRGTVRWFNQEKGFGFIEIKSGNMSGEDIFVHSQDIEGKPLREADEVEFDVEDDQKANKKRAGRVTGGTGRAEDRKGRGKGGKPGDWDCDRCGFMNFSTREACLKCGEPKGNRSGGGGASRRGRDSRRRDSRRRGGRGGNSRGRRASR